MNNIRTDLTLFGEGEGASQGETCAAEQGRTAVEAEASDSIAESAEGAATENAISRIAALLGLRGTDEESIMEELRERQARTALSEKLRNRRAKARYGELMSQASRLFETQKGFDLKSELADPRFTAMIRSGLSVEEAWRAVHTEEHIERARKEASEKALSEAIARIRQGALRPDENGGSGNAPAKSQTSVESLSGRGIRDILRRVENGAKIKF